MFEYFAKVLADNPVLAGGASMALVGWALVQARMLPLHLLRFLKAQLSTSLTVYSEDSVYRFVDLWLSRHPDASKSRRFSVAGWHDRTNDREDFALSPGAGFHLLREGWRFYLVHRTVEDKGEDGDGYMSSRRRRQTITITTPGRSPQTLYRLLDCVKAVEEDKDTIPIYMWTGHDYTLAERRQKRSMDTVYLEPRMKAAVIRDIRKFNARRAWYALLGVPYRRGISLEGPPGTGKTTLIFALASLFDKAIYIINPATLDNDIQFQRAMNLAGANYVVLEDFDALDPTGERSVAQVEEPTMPAVRAGEASKRGVTLSGLLNAIDGIAARDGRILFITSNHADTLDEALLRPGRIDRRCVLNLIDETIAGEMYRRFYPDGDCVGFLEELRPLLPLSPATVQNMLLSRVEADDAANIDDV
ncbi:AAA+ ATPase protein [Brevundimonas phage vB_BpoS-Gurke]|uniref:AAA+ ATPase protein n=1 Tax=Brevundimonas phage vB_BpoS-Gurke TaxID=2948599 RepID=A0A9E7SS07_9CAUD|nr:AAA+ ATPase protein [Brevundimonas phage vB_BpoS-Gurke]